MILRKGKEMASLLWQVWLLADRLHMGLIAAGIAFYAIFSLFPALAALIALFGLIADPTIVTAQIEVLREVLPGDVYNLISAQLNRLLSARSETLGWATALSLLLALWSARAGVAALIRGLNAIHGRPMRKGLRHTFVALLITLSLIGVAMTALSTVVILPILLALLPFPVGTGWIIEASRWGLALAVIFMAISILYRFGPNRRGERPGWITPGGLIVIAAWFAASAGFSAYLSNFGSYNEVYGSIGAAVAMLMWLYISSYLLLFGAALNVVLERRASGT